MAQEKTNPDVNERGKLLLERGKTPHEIPAPSSYSEQPARIQLSEAGWAILLLQICPFVLADEKMLSCLSQKRGTARDSTGFGRHQHAELILRGTGGLLYSKDDSDQVLFTIYSPFLSSKFLAILLLKAFQASSDMHKPGLQYLCACR